MTPSVDVVIPCYRYGSVLPTAVRSVLDQPDVDVRVLVIDDASPDDSADVARSLAEQDGRVEVDVHPRNRGHIATYNEGLLDWAKADYSVLLSADDALTPGALGRATALLQAHPEVGFAYGRPLHWDGSDPLPQARTAHRGWTVHPGRRWLDRRFRTGNGCITSPEVVVRTAVQQEVGGYDPTLTHSGDIEMWMRFAARADVGFLRGVDQAYYRVHGSNMSVGYYGDGGVGDLNQRLAAYLGALAKSESLRSDAPVLERRIRRLLARTALQRVSRAHDRGRVEADVAAALVAFAEDAAGDVRRLPEWPGLTVRRALTRRSLRLGPFSPAAARRTARDRVRRQWWLRTGV